MLDIIVVKRLFEKIEIFFERIKRMNVFKFFLITWVIHFIWTVVIGMILVFSGAKFSQHVAPNSEFTNSFLLVPFTAVAEEMLFRWAPLLILTSILTYGFRKKRLSKEQFFYVERYCLLVVAVVSSVVFGWVHGSIFNVLLQGVSGIIFFIVYLRCFFIERDLGVRDRWQVIPLAESSFYHGMANASLIFL